jgi:heme/copper-type cytochrome/quinol oxidase subunit 2
MNIPMMATRSRAEKQLSGLGKLVVGALIGFSLMYVYIQAALIKQIEMPLPIFSVVSLVLAALVAGRPIGGWRWTPLLGSLWSLVLVFGKFDLVLFHLAHPENTLEFALQLVMLVLATVGVVMGIGATIQNYRRPAGERRLPGWVSWSFTALAGLLVGAVVVAAIPQTGSGVQISPAVLAQLPPVTLEAFNGGEIRVKAHELTALRLENSSSAGHSFDVDELNLHVAMPSNADSLALFTANTPGTYTFYCTPHYDKASGKGMHGTLIVEP